MIITWHLLLYLLLLFDWRMRITFDTPDVYLYCFSLLYLNILYDYYHYYTQWWIATTILYDIYFHNKFSARAQRNITERKKHTYIWVLHVRKQILGFSSMTGDVLNPLPFQLRTTTSFKNLSCRSFELDNDRYQINLVADDDVTVPTLQCPRQSRDGIVPIDARSHDCQQNER